MVENIANAVMQPPLPSAKEGSVLQEEQKPSVKAKVKKPTEKVKKGTLAGTPYNRH